MPAVTENDIATAFAKYDADASGNIGSKELGALAKDLGHALSAEELKEAVEVLDRDASGTIEMNEFVAWWKSSKQDGDNAGVSSKLGRIAKAGKNEILEAKLERQQAERDVQLLMNRLQHLKMEEDRARKKIAETKGRADEIHTLKRRNNERMKERADVHAQRERYMQGDTDALLSKKKENHRNIEKAKGERHALNRQSAQDTQAARHSNEDSIKQQKAAFKEANAAMRATIQERQAIARKKRADTNNDHQKALAAKAQARLKEERDRRSQAEKMIQEMEAEEERLIERLRNTQDKQRTAYQELEVALQS
jgi:hypothetical protein